MSDGATTAGAHPVLEKVQAVLVRAHEAGVVPAWDAEVVRAGHVLHRSHGGDAQVVPSRRPLGERDLFDVASLTKVMATTTLAAMLVEAGKLDLDEPAATYWPAFGAAGKERVTVRQLLAHSSGLPWWRPWSERAMGDEVAGQAFLAPDIRPDDLADAFTRGREILERAVAAEPLEATPGTRALYGDPAFIALGFVVERVAGAPLDRLFEERVADRLGLSDTIFVGPGRLAAGIGPCSGRRYAGTEDCPHRHEVNRGTVNDDNAWAMGGVAGHAGLFSTAEDVARLGQEWLEATEGHGSILGPDVARAFVTRDATPGSERALGWDTPSAAGSSIGSRLGRGPLGAIGHLGYTGCSLWIDRDRELVCALLTNHVHPGGRRPAEILALRQAFHDAVAEELG